MIKNKNWILGGFCVLLVAGLVVAVSLKDRSGADIQASGSLDASLDAGAGTSLPDDVALSPLSDGDEMVENNTAGYYFAMPVNWYAEESTGPGLAVYPDYDPATASSSPASCKIEISAFAAPSSTAMDDWITTNLHTDPTADISEVSRTPISVGESGGGSGIAGIEWQGTLNGVTTTLAYASANGTILEIAPSTLSEASDATNDDCTPAFQALIANLHLGSYKP